MILKCYYYFNTDITVYLNYYIIFLKTVKKLIVNSRDLFGDLAP